MLYICLFPSYYVLGFLYPISLLFGTRPMFYQGESHAPFVLTSLVFAWLVSYICLRDRSTEYHISMDLDWIFIFSGMTFISVLSIFSDSMSAYLKSITVAYVTFFYCFTKRIALRWLLFAAIAVYGVWSFSQTGTRSVLFAPLLMEWLRQLRTSSPGRSLGLLTAPIAFFYIFGDFLGKIKEMFFIDAWNEAEVPSFGSGLDHLVSYLDIASYLLVNYKPLLQNHAFDPELGRVIGSFIFGNSEVSIGIGWLAIFWLFHPLFAFSVIIIVVRTLIWASENRRFTLFIPFYMGGLVWQTNLLWFLLYASIGLVFLVVFSSFKKALD